MKKMLLIALLISSCSQQKKDTVSVNSETKRLPVIGYNQYVESKIIPDESKNDNYPDMQVDPCFRENCIKSHVEKRDNFINNISDNCQAIFLSKVRYNRHYINEDRGYATSYNEIKTFPFDFKSTWYNDKDSSCLHISNPVGSSENLILKLDADSYSIKAGDTLTIVDTLMARKDSTYCWVQMIITKEIINFGIIPTTEVGVMY